MSARLVAIDEGPDINLDRAMVVVGRHPACDVRLDSLRVSRHHCCIMPGEGEVLIRDLGSTNGIRINGLRVGTGRLRAGDELCIAHIRYRLDGDGSRDGGEKEAESPASPVAGWPSPSLTAGTPLESEAGTVGPPDENDLAEAVRRALPSAVAHRCRIEVIVHLDDDEARPASPPVPSAPREAEVDE